MIRKLGGLALALALAGPRADAAPKVALRFATLAPEGSPWMKTFEAVRRDALEATGGEVGLRMFPAGILGEEREVLFKIRAGQVDGGAFLGNGIARLCPDARALMQPLTFRNHEEVDAVFPALRPRLEALCRENGFVALGWSEVGFSYMYSTQPVRSLADLRAAKPWQLPGDELLSAMFEAGRVNAIPVGVGDVLTALQTGMIRTLYAPPLAAIAMQWHTRVRYRNDVRLMYSIGGVFLAERAWNAVPEKHRAALLEIFDRHLRDLTLHIRKSNEEALAVMTKQGIETIVSPEADLEELRAIGRAAQERVEGRLYSREIAEELRRALEAFRGGREAGADVR